MSALADPCLDELIDWISLFTNEPAVIALDGRSGAGKSTLAHALGRRLGALVIEGDDFFDGGVELRTDSLCDRASACIDWRRQGDVLRKLKAGEAASYRAFDWAAFDGRLETTPRLVRPQPLIILEGVYSARPELADLIDLRMLLSVPEEVRTRRLLEREGRLGPWDLQWHEAEHWYFARVMPADRFDIVVAGGDPSGTARSGARLAGHPG